MTGIINQILDTLEIDFGKVFTRSALAFITLSTAGVSDEEILDLMSLDDEVLNHVFQYSSLPTRRLPSHTWLRLKHALEGLIVEHETNCYVWYHR